VRSGIAPTSIPSDERSHSLRMFLDDPVFSPDFMSLRIYNTLTRALDVFVPIETGRVRMYVCGITV
jgi:hypothetical protein